MHIMGSQWTPISTSDCSKTNSIAGLPIMQWNATHRYPTQSNEFHLMNQPGRQKIIFFHSIQKNIYFLNYLLFKYM